MLKAKIRIILSFLFYNFIYRWNRKRLSTGYNNVKLKPGITAVISAKDEDYLIGLCLRSLVGVADQIICIDNGSADNTLAEMLKFENEFSDKLLIEVVSMPGALLGDCRNEGLKRTKFQWHLRWDADMISVNEGEYNMLQIKERIMKTKRPLSVQLPRTNLNGDFFHTAKNSKVVDEGEPFLVWFNKDIDYKEYGKFDAIRIPLYYKQISESKSCIFHCQGIKSTINLIHRFHYFTWRELVNTSEKCRYSDVLHDFEEFKKKRNNYLFGTNEEQSLNWRYNRQLSTHFVKYEPNKYYKYPSIIQNLIDNDTIRYKVIYEDNSPYNIIDKEDINQLNYKQNKEDLEWNVEDFFKKLLNEFETPPKK